jgi:hypothetical protein
MVCEGKEDDHKATSENVELDDSSEKADKAGFVEPKSGCTEWAQ